MGCTPNVLSSVSEVLQKHDRCIVLEDDVLPYPLFLSYMNEALELYKDDEKMLSIGAYSHHFRLPAEYKDETYLIKRFCTWGWGTWKKAWEKISLEKAEMDLGLSDLASRTSFAKNGEDLLRTYSKFPNSWGVRLCFQQWKHNLYTLLPIQSMVLNIGKDGSGVHYDEKALKAEEISNSPNSIPAFNPLLVECEALRKAFIKPLRKPAWRKIAVSFAHFIGIYGFLLKKANQKKRISE
jgi:hypothetical protein